MATEKINPLRITMHVSGNTYELDFNRDAVRFAEAREFVIDDVVKYTQTKVSELFFYAFRWHHRNMSKGQTDAILEEIGGLTPKMLERLILLYQQAQMSNALQENEDLEKNESVTVEL